MNSFTLPASIYSTQDLAMLIIDVRSYSGWFSNFLVAQKANIKPNSFQPEISETSAEIIRQWAGREPLDQARLDNLINQLEKIKSSAPTMTITLAGPAPSTIKRQLVDWCRQNIDPNILVTIRFNRTILGGMVLHYDSRIYDWSIRKAIADHKDKFPEMLARV